MLEVFGWRVWRGVVGTMRLAHQHNELEFNLVMRGTMTYLFGGELRVVEAGAWLLFWGALPHVLVAAEPETECLWLTVPLEDALRLQLPERLIARVLHGWQLLGRDPADRRLFQRWFEDFASNDPERRRILELELEARLRRLALGLGHLPSGRRVLRSQKRGSASAAISLASIISVRYLEPLTLPEIAAAANLHVNYAATLFKKTFGMTMLEYLTQHRLAHAQRLLVTTETDILSIAFESGFQSASAFYAAFGRGTGQTPLAYRRSKR